MSENFYTQPECGYGEQLVSYLYEEIDPREHRDFEEHLRSCLICPPEIVAFQEMRFAFGDWRKAEAVQVPRFVAADQVISQESEAGAHWLDWLRNFVFSPARSFAAAAVLIALFAGLYFISINRSQNLELSQNTPEAVERKPENVIANAQPDFSSPQPDVMTSAPSALSTPTMRGNDAPSNQTSAKISHHVSKPTSKIKPVVRPNNAQLAKNERPPSGKKVPRILTVDEEDRSLRLADIFDEVSMK